MRLYNTRIVRFYVSGAVTLHTGGYRTVTTKERLNQFISGRVYQRKGAWFLQEYRDDLVSRERCFEEGIGIA